MRIAILGGGLQGRTCAYDLALSPEIKEVVIADVDNTQAENAVAAVHKALKNNKTIDNTGSKSTMNMITDRVDRMFRVAANTVDVTQHARLVNFLRPYDVVVSAVPYFLNPDITRAAIDAGTHMVDMGGNTDIVFEQRQLNDKAKAAGVCVLPDCGLAPGLANILAADGIQQMDSVDNVNIRVGGLPQQPKPPLNYQLFFSIHGLINEYMGNTPVLRNGKRVMRETFTELETLHFDGFAHELEAFITLGGLSTLPWTFENKVQEMTYKTIRYPGHWDIFKSMMDLGLLDDTPVKLGKTEVVPRELFIQQAEPRMTGTNPADVVLVRVTVSGIKHQEPRTLTYELIDEYDPETGFTAMTRSTAFPVSIVAQMLANGTIQQTGVQALEEVVPTQAFIDELAKRNLRVGISLTANTPV